MRLCVVNPSFYKEGNDHFQWSYAHSTLEATQMNNKTITPSFQQPVDRIASGQLPSALAELSEAALSDTLNGVLPQARRHTVGGCGCFNQCSYDGDDE